MTSPDLTEARAVRLRMSPLVSVTLGAAFLGRVLTEDLGVLPREIFNLADLGFILVLVVLLVLFVLGFSTRIQMGILRGLFLPILIVTSLSTLLNADQIAVKPAVTFWLLMLQGPLLYLYLINTESSTNRDRYLIGLLLGLSLLQPIWVVARGQVGMSADSVSGTFGVNPSQLCFVCVLVICFALSKTGYLTRRQTAWSLAVFVPLFFMPNWRAMWVGLPGAVLLTRWIVDRRQGVMRWVVRLGSMLVVVVSMLAIVVGIALWVPASADLQKDQLAGFRNLWYELNATEGRLLYDTGKVLSYAAIPEVFSESLHYQFVGTGPGTYNSRAFHTFAQLTIKGGAPEASVVHNYVKDDRPYVTGVSERHILPILNRFSVSGTIGSTLGTYPSWIVEIGVIGFGLWVVVYGRALKLCGEIYRADVDPIYRSAAFGAAGFLAFTILASLLDDWFAVGRMMIIPWSILAVLDGVRPQVPYAA